MSEIDYLHDTQFIIDKDLRTITVPPKGVVLGVVTDTNVNRVNFKMDRYYDGFDMSTFEARIDYVNANGDSNFYIIDDMTVEDNSILFSWLVDSIVTETTGDVRFSVKLTKEHNNKIVKSFSTSIAKCKVLEGVNAVCRKEKETENSVLSYLKGEYPNCDSDIPRIYLTGNTTGMTKETPVDLCIKYVSKNLNFEGIASIKWQGNFSLRFPKKNFKISLFKDANKTESLKVNFKGWGKHNKFVLKANYIDFSHSRNVVSARIWSNVVSDRFNYSDMPKELKTTPNNGAIDGFLVKVFMNGKYQGRYTLTYGKDELMWNMDKTNVKHAAVCSEGYDSGCFLNEAILDGSDWSLEFPNTLNDSIKDSLNDAIRFVMTSTDEEFVNNISNYFNLESLIDYYIFAYVSCGIDSLGKNQILMTYDGIHWIASMYDMDSTWGLYWDGTEFVSTSYKCQEDYESGVEKPGEFNKLYVRLSTLFAEQIRDRYYYLRTKSLSEASIIEEFEKFMTPCSKDLVNKDLIAYPDIPSHDIDHEDQIIQFIINRLKYVDLMIMNGSTTITLREDFSPNGESWSDEVSIDFANGQSLKVEIDSIGSEEKENILSIGESIDEWNRDKTALHMYSTKGDSENGLELFINVIGNDDASMSSIETSIPLTIELNKDGLYINNALYTPTDEADTYNDRIANLLELTNIEVGSLEGDKRSAAHYNYIKVD